MTEWIRADDPERQPPAGVPLLISRSTWPIAAAGRCEQVPRANRVPRLVWFGPQGQRIRAPDYYAMPEG